MIWKESRWRKEPSFWDELSVPKDRRTDKEIFEWLLSVAPSPAEHDYVLYTDGSGDTESWGASAAILDFVDLDRESDLRIPMSRTVQVSAAYGSTVQRREFTSMLDGLHTALTHAIGLWDERMASDPEERYETKATRLTGQDRLSVLWITDRANLAKSLLYYEDGEVVNTRAFEKDLWMRYTAMAKHFCVTPMLIPRNSIPEQALCDALCGDARVAFKTSMIGSLARHLPTTPIETWTQKKSQKAAY